MCEVRFEFKQIEEGDTLKVLMSLDPNKACGADGISAKLLKMVAPANQPEPYLSFQCQLDKGRDTKRMEVSTCYTSAKKGR